MERLLATRRAALREGFGGVMMNDGGYMRRKKEARF